MVTRSNRRNCEGEPLDTPVPSAKPPRRRWCQWRLRTLLIVMTFCAIVLSARRWYLEPIRRSHVARTRLAELGAGIKTEPAGPAWLRGVAGEDYLKHVVAVELWTCKFERIKSVDPEGFLMGLIADFPRLRELSLGSAISDRSLDQLVELKTLQSLDVAGSKVSVAGAERFASARPEVELDVDYTRRLYSDDLELFQQERLTVSGCVYRFQVAADWKMACARGANSPESEIAALERLEIWSRRLREETARFAAAGRPQGSPADMTLADCSWQLARLRLAVRRGEQAESAAIARQVPASVERLRRRAWEEYSSCTDPAQYRGYYITQELLFKLDAAHALALAVAGAGLSHHPADASWKWYVADLQQLVDETDRRAREGLAGGGVRNDAKARCWLAHARFHLAELKKDRDRQSEALSLAPEDARRLREWVDAAYEQGTECRDNTLICHAKARDLELAWARLRGDRGREREILHTCPCFLAHAWLHHYGRSFVGVTGSPHDLGEVLRVELICCLIATWELDTGGQEAFRAPAMGPGRCEKWAREVYRQCTSGEDSEPRAVTSPPPDPSEPAVTVSEGGV